MLCITIFLHTDPYEHVGKVQKKKKRILNIYTSHTHTNYILKKKRKKERNTPQHILLHLHEKINNQSKRRKDRMLIRFIFAPFHVVGLQPIVYLSDHCLESENGINFGIKNSNGGRIFFPVYKSIGIVLPAIKYDSHISHLCIQ